MVVVPGFRATPERFVPLPVVAPESTYVGAEVQEADATGVNSLPSMMYEQSSNSLVTVLPLGSPPPV